MADENKNPPAPKVEEVSANPVWLKLGLTREQALERELRQYVKSGHNKVKGGFCKGLSGAQMARAKEIMKALGRTKPEWDPSINIHTNKELATFTDTQAR